MASLKYKSRKWFHQWMKDHGWVDADTYNRLYYDYQTVVRQRNDALWHISHIKVAVNEAHSSYIMGASDEWDT